MQRQKVRSLTLAAMLGAIAFILMFFSFSVPVLSPFADFDFSYLPELIGGFILGPAGALEIIGVKILLKLVFKGTSSMFTGEVQKFLLSAAYVLPAVLYYRKHRTKRGAAIGIVLGCITLVVVAIFTNIYLIFPAYIHLYGMNWDAIIDICNKVNPYITSIPTFVLFSVVPFNIISGSVIGFITMLLYKKISVPLKKMITA